MITALIVILFFYGAGMLVGPFSILMIESEDTQYRFLFNKSVPRKQKTKFLARAFVGSWIFYVRWALKDIRSEKQAATPVP